eukprot:TRINITY_DN16709_c0_g1_i1.p2 TRINITY_DN16709_c0_g1~~TRINITY_DN16709_c0_g1_i1.p2  ORF type:complete len:131 (+),score=55.68 TRINITY_DN16709_c0_g1_i1:38-394(+)
MGDHEFEEEDQEITLNSDKITEILEEAIKQTLQGQAWQPKKVEGWTSNIIEHVLKRLAEMKKPFKYIVTCIIMQKTGAGLHSSFSAFWDNSADGICCYPLMDNDTIQCVVTVYGLKLD